MLRSEDCVQTRRQVIVKHSIDYVAYKYYGLPRGTISTTCSILMGRNDRKYKYVSGKFSMTRFKKSTVTEEFSTRKSKTTMIQNNDIKVYPTQC